MMAAVRQHRDTRVDGGMDSVSGRRGAAETTAQHERVHLEGVEGSTQRLGSKYIL